MSNYKQYISTVFNETMACQNVNSPQSLGREHGAYKPFGPYIPSEGGSYPTTDAAMEALARLADSLRDNNPDIRLSVSSEQMRKFTMETFGVCLAELASEHDQTKHWKIVRPRLLERARSSGQNITHYIPVWLFLGQETSRFSIGPVLFLNRDEWLDEVTRRYGKQSSWIPTVRSLWAGQSFSEGSRRAGLRTVFKMIGKGNFHPTTLYAQYKQAMRFSEPRHVSSGRSVARIFHPDHWTACARIEGFEPLESRRRGLLATQVALDTIRLALARPSRGLISTVVDATTPVSIERLSQVDGRDVHTVRGSTGAVSAAVPDLPRRLLMILRIFLRRQEPALPA